MWIVFVLFLLYSSGGLADLIVQTENGKVQGTTIHTPSGRIFYAWRGIPFGQPPIGKLRYLPPLKAEPWEGILDASKDSPACIFFSTMPGYPEPLNGQSEDCLYLNVYSPVAVGSNSSVDPTLPVMFWIYGGGFGSGTGDFAFSDPTPFLEENVIMVTFNYRLGALGFLSTEDDAILGNAGLKDQWLALTWIKENIAFFGGNPSEVTIFGVSAGAMSVGYLIVSPMSRGLFKAAILESGSALSSTLQTGAREFTYSLASQIDSSITKANTTIEVRETLQAADIDVLKRLSVGQMMTPVIEIKSNYSFLSTPLYETVDAGDIARVPIIIGYVSEESIGSIRDMDSAITQAGEYDANPDLVLPKIHLKENVSAKAVAAEIYEKYLGTNGSFVENLATYLEWWSDNRCLRHLHKFASLYSKFAPVYMYQFSYYGTMSKSHVVVPGAGKVGHMDEVGYLFNISANALETEEDYVTRKRLVKLWSNFAKTSNPTPDDDSADLLGNIKWEPLTQDNLQCLYIDDDLKTGISRKVNETIFWDYIWNTYSYHPYNSF